MDVKTEATVDDLALIDVDGKAELVHGEIVVTSPAGGVHNLAAGAIYAELRNYSRERGHGHAFTDHTAFLVDLPNRKSFSPDVAYYFGPVSKGFLAGPPAFAVEVRTASNHGPSGEKAMAEKRSEYFETDTFVVWDVDLEGTDSVRCYTAENQDQPIVFRRGERAHAEPAIPGWSMDVDELWS